VSLQQFSISHLRLSYSQSRRAFERSSFDRNPWNRELIRRAQYSNDGNSLQNYDLYKHLPSTDRKPMCKQILVSYRCLANIVHWSKFCQKYDPIGRWCFMSLRRGKGRYLCFHPTESPGASIRHPSLIRQPPFLTLLGTWTHGYSDQTLVSGRCLVNLWHRLEICQNATAPHNSMGWRYVG